MNIGHEIFEWLGEPSVISRCLSVGGLLLAWLYRRLAKKYSQMLELMEKSKTFVDKETMQKMVDDNKKEVLHEMDKRMEDINHRFEDINHMISLVKN